MNAGDVVVNAASGCALAFAGSWLISLFRSVKLLDDDRVVEIRAEEHARNISTRQSDDKDKQIARLQEALAKRHPHDEELEAKVRARVDGLSEAGQQALRWLFDTSGAELGTIIAAGKRGGFNELISTVTPVQLVICTGRIFRINPRLGPALRNVLYSPDGPVTPSPG
jgi:hypothetical protein